MPVKTCAYPGCVEPLDARIPIDYCDAHQVIIKKEALDLAGGASEKNRQQLVCLIEQFTEFKRHMVFLLFSEIRKFTGKEAEGEH